MDVTKENFEEQCKLFFNNIDKTSYLAIDLEFTGIKTE